MFDHSLLGHDESRWYITYRCLTSEYGTDGTDLQVWEFWFHFIAFDDHSSDEVMIAREFNDFKLICVIVGPVVVGEMEGDRHYYALLEAPATDLIVNPIHFNTTARELYWLTYHHMSLEFGFSFSRLCWLFYMQGWLKSAILGRGSSYRDFIFFGLKSRGGVPT